MNSDVLCWNILAYNCNKYEWKKLTKAEKAVQRMVFRFTEKLELLYDEEELEKKDCESLSFWFNICDELISTSEIKSWGRVLAVITLATVVCKKKPENLDVIHTQLCYCLDHFYVNVWIQNRGGWEKIEECEESNSFLDNVFTLFLSLFLVGMFNYFY
jgi:hypothetical protein